MVFDRERRKGAYFDVKRRQLLIDIGIVGLVQHPLGTLFVIVVESSSPDPIVFLVAVLKRRVLVKVVSSSRRVLVGTTLTATLVVIVVIVDSIGHLHKDRVVLNRRVVVLLVLLRIH